MKKYTAKDFGYNGDEMLMHSFTGSVDTAENWVSEANEWEMNVVDEEGNLQSVPADEESIREQLSALYEVKRVKGDWISKE